MAAVSSLNIGPIATTPYDFKVKRSAPTGTKGFRMVTFSGTTEQSFADQLAEMVSNPANRSTVGGVTGAQEYVTATSPALRNFVGYYLLTSFDSDPDGIDPNWPFVSFSLTGVLIGDLV